VWYEGDLVEAEFMLRENRFAAQVRLDRGVERAHVPNSGRMAELLLDGAAVLLHHREAVGRSTAWDLVMVEGPRGWVSIDSRVPNRLVRDALLRGAIPRVAGMGEVRAEVPLRGSRIDFALSGDDGKALVEVKGCTLVRGDGLALFPDAPTARGARHMRELASAVADGVRGLVVVVVQREDGRVFAPNDPQDPDFGNALRAAAAAGVEVLAYGTRVSRRGVELADQLPVDLHAALEVVS